MCGIVAYIGNQDAFPLIIKGLKRLEYRGYDSTGISIHNGGLEVYKKAGKVAELEFLVEGKAINGNIGIGHTRWATHGEPNDVNAHPHFSANKSLSIIHNGIIENYGIIKEQLLGKGYSFVSDTDTEVLITFIEDIKEKNGCNLEQAVRMALNTIEGAYAIVILDKDNPDQLIAARKGSPMVLGIGSNEYFVASDATPIIEYTNEVVYLNDREIAIINRDGFKIKNIEDVEQTPYIQTVELKLDELEKGGYEHFMLKEIFEQPNSIADSMRGRLDAQNGNLNLGGIYEYSQALISAKRIVIIACGTSWHSGLVAEYIFEEYCRIPVEVEYASEFRYRNPIIHEGDIVIAISQSGETADTLAAIELAKSKGAIILGIVNVVGSSISRITHEGAYLHTGPEIGVASTKAFTGQLSILTMLALRVAFQKGTITQTRYKELLAEFQNIPDKIKEVLDSNDTIKEISERFKDAKTLFILEEGTTFLLR